MSNWFVVEAENDWAFLKGVVQHLNLELENSEHSVIHVEGRENMKGLNASKLRDALTNLREDLGKEDVRQIGIVLDNDGRREERIGQINTAILEVFGQAVSFRASGDSAEITIEVAPGDTVDITISCFLTGVDDTGELETVLKAIHTQDAVFADCLESWRECLKESGKTISDKDFDKFWVNNYVRYDTCTRRQRKQAGEKCSTSKFGYIMDKKPEIWDLGHDCLSELHDFLRTFV